MGNVKRDRATKTDLLSLREEVLDFLHGEREQPKSAAEILAALNAKTVVEKVPAKRLARLLKKLREDGHIQAQGVRRGMKYIAV